MLLHDLFYLTTTKKATILIFKKQQLAGGQSFKVDASMAAIINHLLSFRKYMKLNIKVQI